MAAILKKVFGAVLTRSPSSSSSSSSTSTLSSPRTATDSDDAVLDDGASMGVFDRIPTDVFIQILRLLGPKETARACVVCKAWRFLASDNRLWISFLQSGREPYDTVVFTETHLRSGFPLKIKM